MPTLLTPFRYVTIRHQAKLLYDVILPITLGLAVSALLLGLTKPVPIFGKEAYLGQIQGLLTILGGFFVAALTLITTDKSDMLGQPVGGLRPPRLPSERLPLSRRRFLAYLFGYLAASCFALVALSVLANLVAPQIVSEVAAGKRFWLKAAFLVPFNIWLAHVSVATLLGLFYFTERLKIANRTAKVGTPDAAPSPERS